MFQIFIATFVPNRVTRATRFAAMRGNKFFIAGLRPLFQPPSIPFIERGGNNDT